MLFYWIDPGRVAGGSCPHPEDLPRLRRQGFDTLVSLLEDRGQRAYTEEEARAQFSWFSVPMADHQTPDLEQLLAVHERLQADGPGRRTLVHCYAGVGRTGLVALSYLLANGLSEAEAIRVVDDWTGGAFSSEIRSRRKEVRRLLRDFLAHGSLP
ncbi:MAG: dual specificity protein phosphatase family protein [Thermoplasmata archaeon]